MTDMTDMTDALSKPAKPAKPITWFEYPIRVQPHHTDYGGVVWHGSYVSWLESARVDCLRTAGVPLEQFVSLGYDLPVVEIQMRYRKPLTLGMAAIVKTRLAPLTGVRLHWLYEIETIEPSAQICMTAQVTLVTVDIHQRKMLRRLPREVQESIDRILDSF
jgi:acyl-CoA thioester hydrolase